MNPRTISSGVAPGSGGSGSMPTSSTGRAGAWVICTVARAGRHGRAGRRRRAAGPAAAPTGRPAAAHAGAPGGGRRPAAAAAASWSGRRRRSAAAVSRNWAPAPGWPQTCSQPPCRRASSRLIDRPRPLPPTVRTREGSARQNRSNTCWASAELRPDAEVAHGHRGRGPVGGEGDLDRLPGAVLDGVADQVAQDALHPAGVDLGDDVLVGPVRPPARSRAARPAPTCRPRPGRPGRRGRSPRSPAPRRRRRSG